MTQRMHGLFLPLVFPTGVAPGEGGDYNTLTVARNGQDKPVLRGTAIAGALRHAWQRHLVRMGYVEKSLDDQVAHFFGYSLGDDSSAAGTESSLQVGDSILDIGNVGVVTRTHHLRNRHTGTVADGGLFSLQACPPGTKTTLALWLRDNEDSPDEAAAFLRLLVGFLERGIPLGGKAARGIGIARLCGQATYRVYELSDIDDYATWLDDRRAWRLDARKLPDGNVLTASPDATSSTLEIKFSLGIPRGQDILVGDGQGLTHEIEPQRVQAADGKAYWRLPGASLRGLFRSWVTKLAAREGKTVADHVQRHLRAVKSATTGEPGADNDVFNGANLGWCFLPDEDRRPGRATTDCPVAGLFGSLFHSGRLQISDAYAVCTSKGEGKAPGEEQLRKHVAVDRITGGAAEGMLFENTVLTAYPDGSSPRFDVTMRIQDPTDNDGRWLARALQALDLGILRIGSSKSSGRLSLMETPQATGAGAGYFAAMRPVLGMEMFSTRVSSVSKG